MARKLLVAIALLLLPMQLSAKDSLGIFDGWGAFRDPAIPRCYAIALAKPSRLSRDYQAFASVGNWPRRGVRGQLHFRLSRKLAARAPITLAVGNKRFVLIGGGGDAWAQDKAMDAAIVAAMRSISTMVVSSRDAKGRRFSDTYLLQGAATAMDAATIGCARLR
ncbi:hypothetical protein GCM10011515_14970 [Tsuneonella deserti]|uniref:Uncharacterized protein n=1 Tax=Tsuneonella deserti TaxID=2035528 RepID=A0ABQ1SAC1_9SPHN|nr:invasion associated locus B family protein [Tsuneonella deserti]GGD96045.1 hypothetical protein GCM10011515_14970 [Tsuneonella deserti]